MAQQDACTLLDTDHQKVERLFTEYQSAPSATRKSQLAQQICMELVVTPPSRKKSSTPRSARPRATTSWCKRHNTNIRKPRT